MHDEDPIKPYPAPEVTIRRIEKLLPKLGALPDDTLLPAPDGWEEVPGEAPDDRPAYIKESRVREHIKLLDDYLSVLMKLYSSVGGMPASELRDAVESVSEQRTVPEVLALMRRNNIIESFFIGDCRLYRLKPGMREFLDHLSTLPVPK